ncbi:MAG TPA: long-chain fatty acid--CoA ligase [Acidimicrobiales bacterium]
MNGAQIDSMRTGPTYERNASVMFVDRIRRSPERTALVVLGEDEISYEALGERLAATVHALRAAGVEQGDRVAFAASNRTEVIEVMAATLHLGGIFVPLNTRLSAAELRFITLDAGAKVILADSAMATLLAPERAALGVDHALRLPDVDEVQDGWQAVSELTGGPIDPLGPPADTSPDDVAVLMYTSGTTGQPKGAMITHGNIVATVHNLMLLIPMGPDSGMLAMAPLFHVGAMALVLGTLATGGRVVILPAFTPTAVFDAIEAQPVTFTFGVPAMFQAMTTDPRFEAADLSSVLLMCAGAPVPESLLHQYLERGAKVTQGYGLTESTAVVSLLESDFATAKLGSAGMPYPLTAVQLRDPEGAVITDAGVDGEIWIRGRNVVRGYWNRPDDTAALLDEDGWLRTGDAGHLDADGFLYITDRIKDMLITGGENVYPAEVEKVLAGHPDIADVAVIGTPDEQWGEVVTAIVVPRPGASVDLDAVQAYAREQLGGYKVPRRLHLTEELPRNASGKVLKRDLRAELA